MNRNGRLLQDDCAGKPLAPEPEPSDATSPGDGSLLDNRLRAIVEEVTRAVVREEVESLRLLIEPPADELISTAEAAAEIGVKRATIAEWCRRGRFRDAVQTGGDTGPWRIPRSAVEEEKVRQQSTGRRGSGLSLIATLIAVSIVAALNVTPIRKFVPSLFPRPLAAVEMAGSGNDTSLRLAEACGDGRYWIRTSDLYRVKIAL